ncbi:MAG TPA: SGNH/GDSL hydrolase family protein [Candidatus Binataceae bacterium]|nr:SGNH/GDSL hydrolase family protein [Candidatus Binataceae bacterium]
MWGQGVRDDYTVPSLLAKRLAEKTDYHVEVFNQGQIGYVTTQEVLLLYELLRGGQPPDVVVFYDGINDCLAAYQNGIPGLSIDEFNRVFEFNILNSTFRRTLYLSALGGLLLDSNVLELLNLIRGQDSGRPSSDNSLARETVSYLEPPHEHDTAEGLEKRAVYMYLFNKRVVEAWGKQFGFRSLFYWQPAIYTKNKLTPYEQGYLGDPKIKELVLGIYRRVDEVTAAEGIRNLSEIFKDKGQTYFSDMVHLNEPGNEIIADTMTGDVAQVLAAVEKDPSACRLPQDCAALTRPDNR